MPRLNRRDFMTSTAAAGLAAAARPLAAGAGPAILTQSAVKPVVISAANGHRFKNGGTKTCVEIAFEKMTRGDDVLDSLIAGIPSGAEGFLLCTYTAMLDLRALLVRRGWLRPYWAT